ncbi:MAG TPA: ABC transporter ATP-binding protein [Planctomycetota bacterium]|nr:ABC transporter ATP-binding protein [Planctomycetota bacterium]
MPAPAAILDVAGVTKSYRSPDGVETPVLRGVDLALAPGASLAICGPSGCGKSTLLNIIGTLDRPSSGRVSLAGRDVTSLSEAELSEVRSRVIGFVFQLHHLLPQCSILENVLVPTLTGRSPDGAPERARTLLDRVGLGSRLGHRPGQLSGGECQRAAVVRALINKPQLLLADEPTGSLDRASAESLARLLGELNREEGVALVYVTHSADLAKQAGRVLELKDGRFDPAAP